MSLKDNEVIPYWDKRVNDSGASAVGFDAKNLKKQDERYHERRLFINQYLEKDLFTVDYGCGIGRYSNLFDDDRYLGIDIMLPLINEAVNRNEHHSYMHLSDPWLTAWNEKIPTVNQIFTSTVLQHNSDEVIVDIFKSFFQYIPNKAIRFVMYEKNVFGEEPKPHVQSLSPHKLSNFIEQAGYKISSIESCDHMIHKENHTLSIITTV